MATDEMALVRRGGALSAERPPPHTRQVSCPPALQQTSAELIMRGLRDVAQMQAEQRAVNQTHQRVLTMQLYLGYSNAVRSQRLEREVEDVKSVVARGQAAIVELFQMMDAQGEALEGVQRQVSQVEGGLREQGEQFAALSEQVEQHQRRTDELLSDYEKRLQEQQATLARQEETLSRLLGVRFRVDFGIDVGIVALSAWLAEARLVVGALRLLLGTALLPLSLDRASKSSAHATLVRIGKFLVFLALTRRFRGLAMRNGVHHSIGRVFRDIVTKTVDPML